MILMLKIVFCSVVIVCNFCNEISIPFVNMLLGGCFFTQLASATSLDAIARSGFAISSKFFLDSRFLIVS